MRYYIIAGEPSGDLHGGNLIRELHRLDPEAEIRAWGGELMQSAGAEVVKHYRDLAFMGFAEVVANLPAILRNFKFCRKDIESFRPDVLILIDYPGFNLRMAEFAHKKGIKVFYYISPQIWAWKQSRVKKVRAYVDEMYVILPFEKDFYRKFGVDVHFVGHPLIDAVDNYHGALIHGGDDALISAADDPRPLVALLPGSRKQEISKMLPLMAAAARDFPDYRFVIAGAPSQEAEYYASLLGGADIPVIFGKTYAILSRAHAALVTSGTATLETAIFKVPQIVCYRGGSISYMLAKNLVKVKYISLVNLIMDAEVVPELIQSKLSVENLKRELAVIASPGERRRAMLEAYDRLYDKLGGVGASARTAERMLKSLRKG